MNNQVGQAGVPAQDRVPQVQGQGVGHAAPAGGIGVGVAGQAQNTAHQLVIRNVVQVPLVFIYIFPNISLIDFPTIWFKASLMDDVVIKSGARVVVIFILFLSSINLFVRAVVLTCFRSSMLFN